MRGGMSAHPDNQTAVTHGAYSKQLQPVARSRLVELEEQAGSREGLVELLTARTAKAILLCEVIESYVVEQKQRGVSLEDMPILKALPAFMNTAQRAISTLAQLQPGSNGQQQSAELQHILEVINEHDKDK